MKSRIVIEETRSLKQTYSKNSPEIDSNLQQQFLHLLVNSLHALSDLLICLLVCCNQFGYLH